MSNDNPGDIHRPKGGINPGFVFLIQMADCLIQEQYSRTTIERTGNQQPLLLTA